MIRLALTASDLADPNTLAQKLMAASRNVPEVYWFDVAFGAPFTPLSIYHRIERIPLGLVQDPFADALVWAEPDDRREWSLTRAVVRCNAENVMVRVGLVVM